MGAAGLYPDRDSRRNVTGRGNYVRDPADIDSLLILVSLKNKSFPCSIPIVNKQARDGTFIQVPIASLSEWPCYIPDIGDIDSRIALQNERGDTLHAKYVWGRRNQQLTLEETLFAMFSLREGSRHFLAGSKHLKLLVTGFDTKLNFALDLEKLR